MYTTYTRVVCTPRGGEIDNNLHTAIIVGDGPFYGHGGEKNCPSKLILLYTTATTCYGKK